MPVAVTICPTFGVGYQSFTNGGLPNNVGYVYTYIAGGTTPQATYTTADGDVANDNPIVFTSSGRPPAEIWLILGQTYRLDLYDADDNLIKSYDDVGGGGGGTATVTNLTVINDFTTNNITVENDGDVDGDLHVGGNLTVDGDGEFNGDVHIDGDLDVDGNINGTTMSINGVQIYAGIPINPQNAGYTLALTDNLKCISMSTAGAFAIPANGTIPFPVGSIVSFYNASASSTITITTDTMRLAGSSSTGTRTLAQYGIATILKVASAVWVISGQGVT